MLSEFPGYDELAERYDFGRPVIERLAKHDIIVGGKTGGRGKWQGDVDYLLYVLEGRQAPLSGAARAKAMGRLLTTEVLMGRLRRSEDTVRDMLKKGELPGWRLKIPEHLRGVAGKRVCDRWYVDEERFNDYRREAMEDSLRRRFSIPQSEWDFGLSGVA